MEYLSIPHYRGLKEKYDEQKHSDGIFFTTDTHEIIANKATYGETIDTWNIADGVLTLTMTSGTTLEITFDEATEGAKGFLSAEDKKKINALEGNFDKKVDKVTGKSLVDDTEIDKLSNLPSKTDLDSSIAAAKNSGDNAQSSIDTHKKDTSNPHNVTKFQVGLSDVDNTSDKNKPISTATQNALNNKVDKEDNKGLSTNDYTTAEKTKLSGIDENANNYVLPTANTTTLGGVIVDVSLGNTTNPVQNKAIKTAIDEINSQLSWAKID